MRQSQVTMFALALALLATRPLAADEVALTVAGTVTVHGQTVADGQIIFYLDDDEFVGTRIKNGAYKVTRVPAGKWRVTIRGDGVPAKFTLQETSGLRVVVEPGRNTMDFVLSN